MNPAFGLGELNRNQTLSKWDILYVGPDLSDEIYRCTSVYILGIHEVCCRNCRAATWMTQ